MGGKEAHSQGVGPPHQKHQLDPWHPAPRKFSRQAMWRRSRQFKMGLKRDLSGRAKKRGSKGRSALQVVLAGACHQRFSCGVLFELPQKSASSSSCWHALLMRIFVELCGARLGRGHYQHCAFSARSDVAKTVARRKGSRDSRTPGRMCRNRSLGPHEVFTEPVCSDVVRPMFPRVVEGVGVEAAGVRDRATGWNMLVSPPHPFPRFLRLEAMNGCVKMAVRATVLHRRRGLGHSSRGQRSRQSGHRKRSGEGHPT